MLSSIISYKALAVIDILVDETGHISKTSGHLGLHY